MEFIDGETVDAYMKRTGPLSPLEALEITMQVSRALGAAVKQQLVHRDLKPANLMLVDEEGEKVVKVIDFGLAEKCKTSGGRFRRIDGWWGICWHSAFCESGTTGRTGY